MVSGHVLHLRSENVTADVKKALETQRPIIFSILSCIIALANREVDTRRNEKRHFTKRSENIT